MVGWRGMMSLLIVSSVMILSRLIGYVRGYVRARSTCEKLRQESLEVRKKPCEKTWEDAGSAKDEGLRRWGREAPYTLVRQAL